MYSITCNILTQYSNLYFDLRITVYIYVSLNIPQLNCNDIKFQSNLTFSLSILTEHYEHHATQTILFPVKSRKIIVRIIKWRKSDSSGKENGEKNNARGKKKERDKEK